MDDRLIQTLVGSHGRAELHSQTNERGETVYRVVDPADQRQVGGQHARFDQAYAAAIAHMTARERAAHG